MEWRDRSGGGVCNAVRRRAILPSWTPPGVDKSGQAAADRRPREDGRMNERYVVTDDVGYEELFHIENYAEASGQALIEDPYPIWAELLAKAPVHKGTISEIMGFAPEESGPLYIPGLPHYTVLSYAACSDVFTRKADFDSAVYADIGIPRKFGDTILSMDGLEHRRYRDVVQALFQPAAAEDWWRNKIMAPLVEQLIDSFGDEKSVDLNARLFARLPMHAVTSAFGLPSSETVEFRRLMKRALDYVCPPEESMARMLAAGEILERTVDVRRKAPQDDMISHLTQADLEEEDGSVRKLNNEEIISFCRLIVLAGGDTTWRQLGIAMFALLSHPEQLKEVIADRSLLQHAILESTRWNPDPLFPRKVKRDTVLHGVELPAGAVLHMCLGAANRDPSRWSDPDKFDIHRPIQRSVAFAAGAHSCLGQHVARQEIETAFNALFDRYPNIRFDPDKPPAVLMGSLMQRGPGPLYVRLD
jgi:cytochrome P450